MPSLDQQSCVLCGHNDIAIIRRYTPQSDVFRKLSVGQCRKCKLIQATPIPSSSQLFLYYSSIYRAPGMIGNVERDHTIRQLSQVSFIENNLKPISFIPKNILDVGAGHGQFLNCLSDAFPNARLFATEVDANCCLALASRGIETKQVLLDELNEPPFDTKFDLIVSSHVLEHARDPKKFLRQIGDMLAPDGVVMIEVPNCGVPYMYGLDIPHLTFFSGETLTSAIDMAGLKVLDLMVGGISALEYVENKSLSDSWSELIKSTLAASVIPDHLISSLVALYKTISRHKDTSKVFAKREQELEVIYKDAFFNGSTDGTFLRALIKKK